MVAARSCSVGADDDDDDPAADTREPLGFSCLTNVTEIGSAGPRRAGYCGKRCQIETPDCLALDVCAPPESFIDGDQSDFVFTDDFSPRRETERCHIATPTLRCQKQTADSVK